MRRAFRKESYIEKYERNLILCGLFLFIIFGVFSFVFIMPRINNFYDSVGLKDKIAGTVEVFKFRPADPVANYKAGIRSANSSMALNYFKKAVESDPNNINYLTELAVAHYRLKNYEEAIQTYQKIISLDKNNVSAYNSIGNIYWIRKNFEKAEIYFNKAMEIDPASLASYNNLALMLNENGKKQEAIAVLQKGIEANADSLELKMTLGIIKRN